MLVNSGVTPKVDGSQIPYESLESTRHRLSQVYSSLKKLSELVSHNRYLGKVKLPTYASLQNQLGVLITQLNSISSQLANNVDVLSSTNVFPTAEFPTTQHEGLVTTLLRKKVLPDVEEWIESALNKPPSEHVDENFAEWCQLKVQELRDEFQFYGFLTVEELDFLGTEEGKKQEQAKKDQEVKLAREEEIISGGKRGFSPNKVNKFMCQGVLE
jgi:mediator of RNA polymerase II transcription subunit 8